MTSKHQEANKSDETATELTLEALASIISSHSKGKQRLIVAIAGPPGSGKSTSAERLQTLLENEHKLVTQIVPMDGFHYDNAILKQLGLSHRKGSPQTFDTGGLASILERLANNPTQDIAIPVFDRDIDLSRGSARLVDSQTTVLLVEGNYLLLKDEGWSNLAQYFDLKVMIACDENKLRSRLMKRWLDLGYGDTEAAGKVEGNDLMNAKLVINQSAQADYVLPSR